MPAGALHPVMVWIHGGGMTTGSGSSPVFDGSSFARKGVVLVSINYRLGRFGFFVHPALIVGHPDEPFGNYGLMDQIAALEWVHANVARFGGDPADVTIFGQSSGGSSVLHLMASRYARGLFAKAIVESGGGREPWAQLHRSVWGDVAALQAGINFAHSVGIYGKGEAAARALRALPAAKVLGDISFFHSETPTYAGPMVDGRIVPCDVAEAFRKDEQAHVPLLIGTTDDELGALPVTMLQGMTAGVLSRFGARETGLAEFYGPGKSRPEDLLDDVFFVEPARYLARLQAATGAPVWLYRFGYVTSSKRVPGHGAMHASELPYVFGTLSKVEPKVSAADRAMSSLIQNYWIAFARTGDPNGDHRPTWPRYGAHSGRLMMFRNEDSGPGVDPLEARLDYITQSYPPGER